MSKTKIFMITGGVLASVILAGGGFWFGVHERSKTVNLNAENTSAAGAADNLSSGSSSADQGGSSLSVGSSSGASNLGQLGVGSGQGSAQGSQQSNGGSSGGTQTPDPSTFAGYEKYKNESHALFGEIQAGTGDELMANKKAAVFYKGWLTNGQMFDQSRAGTDGKLQPFVFTLGAHQVIPGWEEGLAGMKVGGTRLIIVPPSVGYGAAGQGPIPPNSVLVFEVQLAAVQ